MADIWSDLTDAFTKDMAIDEMKRKYENTYLIITAPEGKEMIVLYKGFANDYHWFKDELNVDVRLKHETNCTVHCRFPERRLFNHNGAAYEFIRLPQRQFRRGICKDNAKIYSPIRSWWNSGGMNLEVSLLNSALYPVYPTSCDDAIKQLTDKVAVGVALSPKFFVSQSVTVEKDRFHLFYMNILIGYFQKDTFYIKHDLFRQEIFDNIPLFKPYRIEY